MMIGTIGYEGSEISDFIAVLKHTGIDVLVDVRDFPASRKRGFSKNALKAALEEEGIEYLHLKVLGDPKPGREAARNGEMKRFREIFFNHISNEESRSAIDHLVELAERRNICLMCFERDHKCCHRSILIEEMRKLCNFEVRNLGVPKGFYCEAA
jgi:uncharacterized protein (DUF488 family)